MAKKMSKAKQNQSLIRFVIIGVVAILGLFFGITFFSQTADSQTALAPEVSVDVAAGLRDQGAFILDVRQPEEWEAQHIPGATLIPLGELSARINEIPQDQQVVVVCRSGNRSAQGRDITDSGFSEVTSMGGGMNTWAAKGYDTVTGK